MKLSVWAKIIGISYTTAHRWFKDGKMPIRAEKMPSGSIVVYENDIIDKHLFDKINAKNDPNYKYCSRCKKTLERDKFTQNNSTKDGLADYCKICKIEYQRVWEENNKNRMGEYRKKWEKENKEERKEQSRQWYQENKEAASERMKAWYNNNRNKVLKTQKEYELKRQYNIGLEDYYKMFDQQDGLCAICKKPETIRINDVIKLLSVDHDHVTGKIRQLLCCTCNLALGNVKEDIKIAEALLLYIKKHKNE